MIEFVKDDRASLVCIVSLQVDETATIRSENNVQTSLCGNIAMTTLNGEL